MVTQNITVCKTMMVKCGSYCRCRVQRVRTAGNCAINASLSTIYTYIQTQSNIALRLVTSLNSSATTTLGNNVLANAHLVSLHRTEGWLRDKQGVSNVLLEEAWCMCTLRCGHEQRGTYIVCWFLERRRL